MDPRRPLDPYGMPMSPPPTTQNTMYSPGPIRGSPMRSQVTSPVPGQYNQMTRFEQTHYYESPAPMQASPYPIPSSQSTMNNPPGTDPTVWAQYQEFVRNQQTQRFQQPPANMLPPSVVPPQNPYHPRPPFPQDSGYGSGIYDDLGQAHGLPSRQPQASAPRPGHNYGKVVARGNSRVIRGNAIDSTRPNMIDRQHTYSDAEVDGNADIFDGDVTTEQMRAFYLRG